MYYTLDENKQPQLCHDLQYFLDWHENMPASSDWYTMKTGMGFSVAREKVGDDEVSTVYLGIDHGFGLNGDHGPILWETMIFPDAEVCERYRTYDEAMAGHRQMVESLKAAV